jgi:uncharacterized protein (TIRG00374 family)
VAFRPPPPGTPVSSICPVSYSPDVTQRVRPPISRRSLIGGFVVGVPVSALFLYLAARGLNPSAVLKVISHAQLGSVILAMAAMGVVYSAQAARWRRIAASAGMALPWHAMLRMVISGVALNNLVPGRPGEFLRAYRLSQESGGTGARALSTVIVDRAADLLVLVAALLASYPFLPHPSWLQRLVEVSIAVGLMIVVVLAITRLYVRSRARGGRSVPVWVTSGWLGRQLSRMVHGTAATVNRRDLVAVSLLSALAWGAFAAAAWLVARALGVDVSLPQAVFVTAAVNLGVAIPSSPGFIGAYQWLCVASLGLFGVARPPAFAFAILLEAVWYIPTTLIGLVLLAGHANRLRLHRRRYESVDTPGTQMVNP